MKHLGEKKPCSAATKDDRQNHLFQQLIPVLRAILNERFFSRISAISRNMEACFHVSGKTNRGQMWRVSSFSRKREISAISVIAPERASPRGTAPYLPV